MRYTVLGMICGVVFVLWCAGLLEPVFFWARPAQPEFPFLIILIGAGFGAVIGAILHSTNVILKELRSHRNLPDVDRDAAPGRDSSTHIKAD